MAAIDFPCLLLLIALLASALTSSVNAGPDGTSPVSPGVDQGPSLEPLPPAIEHGTLDDKKGSKNLTSMNTEGGVITISASTQRFNVETTVAATEFYKPDEPRTRGYVPKERNASPSVVARKGVKEKIKPRKGVEQDNPERTDPFFNQSNLTDTRPEIETNSALVTVHVANQPETSNISIAPQSKENSNHTVNSTDLAISHVLQATNVTQQPKASSPVEKHIPKPKPTVTSVEGPEVDDYRPSSRTKSSPSGMPRKLEYIVPVVITIFALPLLGAAIFLLYKRGRDCWDKRHYRRMDFLIDGMYND